MGDEFRGDKRKQKRQRKDAGPTFDQFVEHLRGYLHCKVLEKGKTNDQALDELKGATLAGPKTRRPTP